MKYLTTLFAAAALVLWSCIENDIPYPVVELNIEAIEGEGFSISSIDAAKRTVTLALEEQTDIRNVRIDRTTFGVVAHNTNLSKEALIEQITTSQPLTGCFDLRTPIYVRLSLYQDYDWTITAEQKIERTLSVQGQIGAAEFDLANRTVRVNVSKATDRTHLTVSEMKFGPAGISEYSPTLEELSGTNFESVRFVDVTYHGQTERWLIYVEPIDVTVMLTQVDAWSKVIWLYGAGVEGREMGFRYRKAGNTEWVDVPDVTVKGGSFSARLKADAETTYEVKAFAGADESEPKTVTTDIVWELPNGGFEEWTDPQDPPTPKRKYWLPYLLEGGTPYWDTGNKGSTSLSGSDNITLPSDDVRPGSAGTKSARLSSKWVVLKFAAGNIFTGEYFATKGTNGVVGFGRPCTHRPTALKGWVKFKGGKINRVGDAPVGTEIIKDQTDENAIIYIALGTWTPEKYGVEVEFGGSTNYYGTADVPVAVYTNNKSSFFNPNGEDVIAYGEKVMTEDIDAWTEFTIPLVYKDNATNLQPTHLMIVCSASRWGDYFTGYDKSVLCVDDFELVYD